MSNWEQDEVLNLNDPASAMNMDPEELDTEEATVVLAVIDRSGSMRGYEQSVVDGFNNMIAELGKSKAANTILFSSMLFAERHKMRHGYVPVSQVPQLTVAEYDATGYSTSLYEAVHAAMAELEKYDDQLRKNGTRTRCVVVVLSDGADNSSVTASAGAVKTFSGKLLKKEHFILAYAGFGMQENEVVAIANDIGFQNVLTSDKTGSEIRRTFGQVSASIIRTSQTQINVTSNSFFS